MTETNRISKLEAQLNSFIVEERSNALSELLESWQADQIPIPVERDTLNVHAHSFFSYNAYGYSPSALAWLAKKNAFSLMGIVDFDTLDGVDEFLDGCEQLGVRGIAGMETRIYIPEFKDAVINSPGEPGVAYHMGTGFSSSQVPKSTRPLLADIRQRAEARNRQILDNVNNFLSPLELDYETDILPLTPFGYATERHMIQKIAEKAEQFLDDPVRYWGEKLGQSQESLKELMSDHVGFQNLLRNKLMKRGGSAYMQPDAGTFPSLDNFHTIVEAAEAIPCATWLDGTSEGEQDIERLLDLLMAKGVTAMNIVPDRNWNIADPDLKSLKIKELYRIVKLANDLDLPILVGTEMNSPGQRIVDDFDAPELAPVRDSFIKGAYSIFGHTRMQRLWGMGVRSQWGRNQLPNQKTRNEFFTRMGRLIPAEWTSRIVQNWIHQDLNPVEVEEKIKQRLRDENE